MSLRFQGQVAVLTGGAGGMGEAACLRLAKEGADLVIGDVGSRRGPAIAEQVRHMGRRAIFLEADVSKYVDNEKLAKTAVDEFGRLDILVALAGVTSAHFVGDADPWNLDPDLNYLLNKPLEDWDRVLAVNLTGAMYSNRAAAKQMVALGNGGSIINITSVGAVIAGRGGADYCVSKAGLAMLTKVLALELAQHRIRVNAIGPGKIQTPMAPETTDTEEKRARLAASIPIGRIGQPEDIASMIAFLASDEASFITGKSYYVDGGYPSQ
jgi:NAD(P)-dependent dehydrogenase (short-subunit alcohol dehydrogenase family)